VELNGETLTGMVKAKAQARTDYEDAVSDGHTGVLLSVNADGSHTLELGNLMAGETCTVRMHYVQVLQPEQGSLRLMLPTTLAPRYGDAIKQGRYEPHAVPKVSATVEYPFELTLNVEGELTQARIASPSHPVSIRSLPAVGMKQSLQTEIALARDAWLDRDFVLIFDQLPHASMGLASWDRLESGLGVVMASFSPALPEHHSLPVAVKLLVDCSGSMGGDSIQAARRALQGIVQGLKPGDRFSLSRFGGHVEHRGKALWKAAPAPLAAARRWIEQMDADLGGTEMESAIHSTLKLPGTDRADVLLITDGQIHDIDTVVETARTSRHRFFVVGIGTSASEGLLRRLADATGGACEFVAPGEAVEPATLRLYQRMRSPTITQPRVEWQPACQIHTASDLPRGVFDGDDITVFARLKAEQADALSQPIRLYGRVDGQEKEVLLAEVQPAFIADEHNTLARLAAFQRHRQLSMGAQEVPVVFKKQLPALAEKYQLVTTDTSMVLVKERADAERAIDMPELKQVEGMLAAGWGGRGAVFRQRSGADDLPAFCRKSVSEPDFAWLNSTPSGPYRIMQSMARKMKTPIRSERLRAFIDSMGDSDPQPTAKPLAWQAPPDSRRYWVAVDSINAIGPMGHEFLTPAGLSHGLNQNPEVLWPTSYRGLEVIDVPPRVVEWLQFAMGLGQEEKAMVQAFLKVMAHLEFTPLQTVAMAVSRLLGSSADQGTEAERSLRASLLSVLALCNSDQWPRPVLEYAEPEFSA
jgi:Ca-activated chloride channel family protein